MNEKDIAQAKLDPLFKLKKSVMTLLASLASHKAVVRGSVENVMGHTKIVVHMDPDAFKGVERNLIPIPAKWDGFDVVVRAEVPGGGETAVVKDHWRPEGIIGK